MTLDLDAYMAKAIAPGVAQGVTLRLLAQEDLAQVVAAYPEELRWAMTDAQVSQLIHQRFRSRIPAYLAQDSNGAILGASWCLELARSSIRKIPGLSGVRGYESVSTFLVPEARGKGIAGALKHYSMQQMHEQGFKCVANQIRSDRVASIRMNESLGFKTAAIEDRYCALGLRWTRVHT